MCKRCGIVGSLVTGRNQRRREPQFGFPKRSRGTVLKTEPAEPRGRRQACRRGCSRGTSTPATCRSTATDWLRTRSSPSAGRVCRRCWARPTDRPSAQRGQSARWPATPARSAGCSRGPTTNQTATDSPPCSAGAHSSKVSMAGARAEAIESRAEATWRNPSREPVRQLQTLGQTGACSQHARGR